MRFMMYTTGDDSQPMPPPSPEFMAEMGRFMAEATAAGALVTTGGFAPSSQKITVKLDGGRVTVTDGPFTEGKELVGGWALVDATSRDEAVEWATRFLKVVGGGESTIRQVFGSENFPQ